MPSLVAGRDMNGYDYERGGPRLNGLAANGGFDYRDDFSREDMRRDDDDRYRRGVRNGGPSFDRFNTDYLDQNSLSDFRGNEPKFELDHLATFAAGTRNGVIHAEDGLRKLRQMENTTGIWTMRCVLIVERGHLVIVDNSTGEELEKFPIQLVQDPTAIFKNDRREIYNNLILFTIVDDPKKRSSQADMHIFQSCKAPAQEIVDEILAARGGQQKLYQGGGSRIPPPPTGPAPEPPSDAYNFQGMREYLDSRQYNSNTTATDMKQFNQFNQTSYSQGGQFGGPIGQQRSFITRINTVREKEDFEGGSTEILERDVQLLNHCFDDIEKFVARLQQAAESYKELEKRKKDRGAKNKKRQSGDGMLNARSRPPPDRDFVDIFQKFKLSFNLLAKLKAHIHDPNAPELVHFLFTPLSLIYEASRDPFHGNQNLGDQAVAPVLTADAKQLLLNCLTSKEIELWQALGKHWTTSRDEWQGHIPPYVPEFYDGWQPAANVVEELSARQIGSGAMIAAAPVPMLEPPMAMRTQPVIEERPRGFNGTPRPIPFPDDDRSVDRFHRQESFERFDTAPWGYESSSRRFESIQSRGFESVHAPIDSRGAEPQAWRGSNGALQGYEAHSRDPSPRQSGMGSPYPDFVETHHVERNVRQETNRMMDREPLTSGLTTAVSARQEDNMAYLEELRRRADVTIYEAAHDRAGKNPKELTVQKADILQVMDNSKNWWKLRNYKGEVGFAPYTILKPLKTDSEERFTEHFSERIINGAPSRATTSETSFMDERGASRRDPVLAYLRHRREDSQGSITSPRTPRTPRSRRRNSLDHDRESPVFGRRGSPSRRSWSPQYGRRESPSRDSPRVRRRDSPPRRARSPRRRSWSPARDRKSYGQRASPSRERRRTRSARRRDSPPRYRRDSPSSSENDSPRRRRRASPEYRRNDSPPAWREAIQEPPPFPTATSRPAHAPPPPQVKTKPSAPSYAQPGSKYDVDLRPFDSDKTTHSRLHEELHAKVTTRQPAPRPLKHSTDVTKLTKNSTAGEVTEFLINKGFSEQTRNRFRGYSGRDMFQLHYSDIEPIIGHEEALRLDGLVTLQKNASGYATKSAKELNDILAKRKQQMMASDPHDDLWDCPEPQSRQRDADDSINYDSRYVKRSPSGQSLRDLLVQKKSQLRQSVDFNFSY